MKDLKAQLRFRICFSEIDAMHVVWHGAYPKYFEDAREHFGRLYNLGYDRFLKEMVYAPLVDLTFQYKRPLLYGMKPEITIIYRPADAAKIVFDYEIRDFPDGEIMTTGHSVQVFMNMDYELIWTNPPFYEEWKKENA